jgi:hypothetical protein
LKEIDIAISLKTNRQKKKNLEKILKFLQALIEPALLFSSFPYPNP